MIQPTFVPMKPDALDTLLVGERVILKSFNQTLAGEVVRVTATQIVVLYKAAGQEIRFRKKDGIEINGDTGYSRRLQLHYVTPEAVEHMAKTQLAGAMSNLAYRIDRYMRDFQKAVQVGKVSLEKVKEVHDQLNNIRSIMAEYRINQK